MRSKRLEIQVDYLTLMCKQLHEIAGDDEFKYTDLFIDQLKNHIRDFTPPTVTLFRAFALELLKENPWYFITTNAQVIYPTIEAWFKEEVEVQWDALKYGLGEDGYISAVE